MSVLNRIGSKSLYALTCPGQGIVRAGLLDPNKRHLPLFQRDLDELDSALGQKFSQHLFLNGAPNNNEQFLQHTSNAQPAILASTYITLKVFDTVYPGVNLLGNARFLLGHSLGEYTALLLSGVIDFTTAVRLVRLRGELMEKLVERRSAESEEKKEYGLVALMARPGDSFEQVLDAARQQGVLGNINSRSQIVISGEIAELDKFVESFKAAGNSRAILKKVSLPVNIPFHSEILKEIVPELRSFLKGKTREQKIPIVSNLDGSVSATAEESVEKTLVANYSPVQWLKSMESLPKLGVDTVFNLGPGNLIHNINCKFKLENCLIDEIP
ncbi:uncharacterized protein LODBEIA_P17360 [Lodderomyces beijingensis]|uniref:[acyl-carrier-protein] S-malonyltransferase n=1 Tax=Lodderomyces beijingensis TaxID=1775926 RepID=A0ABP0ZH64_9ASCO